VRMNEMLGLLDRQVCVRDGVMSSLVNFT